QAAALKPILESDVDGRTGRLEAHAWTGRLAQRPTDFYPVLIEYQNVWREWIGLVEVPRTEGRLIVASAPQTVAPLEHTDLERSAGAAEGKAGGKIQSRREARHAEAGRDNDVLTVARIELDILARTQRISNRRRLGGDRQGRGQDARTTEQPEIPVGRK